VKVRGIVVGLAVTGTLFSGAWACGSRTGIELFNEVGVDGGGHDGDVLGEDAVVTDGASGTPCPGAGGSDGPPPPSCAPSGAGMTNCGPGGSGSESCCTSLEVCGGSYYRTYTNDGGGPTGEGARAAVSDFRLDKYLVTVGRFRQFVAAWRGGYYPPSGSGIHAYLNGGMGLVNSGPGGGYETGWDATDWNNTTDIDPTDANLGSCSPASPANTWTATAASNENLPINCVNWYEAYAFCIWDGGFLPSEAEWEYAAVGGSEQREYPWGSMAPGTACPGTGCEYAIYGCYYPSGSRACTGVMNLAPVGFAFRGEGRWDQLDLAGEVEEWNLDVPQGPNYPPCTNCADTVPVPSGIRLIGGGDFSDLAVFLLPPPKAFGDSTSRSDITGFRCARTP
jgi:formylglycine-generating enzyme required for sulfatase activity